MTAVMTCAIMCDHAEGCVASFDCAERLAGDTRKRAAGAGWAYELRPVPNKSGPARSVDLCPKHATEGR